MRRAIAAAAAVLVLAGCGSERPVPEPDATQLRQNLPTQVDGHRVIAYTVDDDSGTLAVDDEESEVEVGATVTIGDREYEVVQVVADDDGTDEPDGWISIRRR